MAGPEAAERYAIRISTEVRAVFAERVVGVWLLGSLAYGGFGPDSDVDLQAAVAAPTAAEIDDLVRRIRHPVLPCPAAGLEFVLYDAAVLEHPRPPLRWSLNLNGGPARGEKISTDPSSESWHWFLLDLAIGRETARTLSGQDLREVAGPISPEHVRAAIARSFRWHARHEDGNTNQIANAARGLLFLRTGRWDSKPAALRWAAEAGIPRDGIVAALAAELGDAVAAPGGDPPRDGALGDPRRPRITPNL